MSKAKYVVLALVLASCKDGRFCERYTIIDSDNGECWRKCAQSAAASEYFEYNFDRCVKTACSYPTEEVCK